MAMTAVVDGSELEVTRLWSARPRISVRGQELPRDSSGGYELRSRRGGVQRVTVRFDWRQFGPRLEVGDSEVLLGRPLPLWVRVAYLVLLVLGVGLGGALGGLLAAASAVGGAELLRRSDRQPSHVALAALLPIAAALVYLAVVSTFPR